MLIFRKGHITTFDIDTDTLIYIYYIYTLKVTRHLEHFFNLLTLQDWCVKVVFNEHLYNGRI